MRQFRLLATAAAIAAVSVTTAAQGKSGNAPKGGTTKVSAPAHSNAGGKKAGGPKTDAAPKDKTAKTPSPGKGRDKTPAATATTAPVPNTVAAKISKNPDQLARVKTMLPDGMTLEQASAGFRNQGQFLAALNASKNQGVSFTALQAAMTDGVSLGQAVKQLKSPPSTN